MEPTSRRRSGGLVMANRFQSLFDVPREHFLSDATKSHDWRIDQLERMERMLTDNRQALYQDFGKPPFEQLFEITVPSGVIRHYRDSLKALMAPQPAPIPPEVVVTCKR